MSYNGPTGYMIVGIVGLKSTFNHLVREVNSKPVTLSVYSVVFKRSAPFSPFSVERPVVAGRVL